jgi:thiamine transport system permease protein
MALLGKVVGPGTIGRTLRAPGLGEVLWFTLWQAVVSTVLTIAVGMVPAYVLARFDFAGRRTVLALVTVPFMLPTVVVGAAFLAVLPGSWQSTARAVIVAHVFFNIAVVVRLVGGMWATLPPDLTGAARTLGASPWQVARHVVLPLLRPSIWGAGLVVFLFTFTSFGVVTILGGAARPTVEVEIARRATQLGDVGGAAVLSLLQVVVLAVLVVLTTRQQRRAAVALRGRAPRRRIRRPGERRLVAVTVVAVVVAMLVPLLAMARRSFDVGDGWSLAAWRQLGGTSRRGLSLGIDVWACAGQSLRFAAVAAALSTVAGALAALAITSSGRAGRLLDAGAMLPLGTSAVTVGLGMLIAFGRAPIDWRAEWWLIPVGQALVATPFVVRLLVPVLRAIPPDLRAAAATLGASPRRAWLEVDGRALARPLMTGAAFAAAISLGEFGATTFLTRTGRETLPIAIGKLLGRPGELPRAQGFATATILLVLTAIVLVAVDTAAVER